MFLPPADRETLQRHCKLLDGVKPWKAATQPEVPFFCQKV